jgi:carboxypeptidase family protein
MKVRLKMAISFSVLLMVFCCTISAAQQRYASGPYKGFVKEEPELNKIAIDSPFRVFRVEGVVSYPPAQPLDNVYFEIRDRSGRVWSSITNAKGAFSIPKCPPGTYDFKVTRNHFYSVVGKLIVSAKKSRSKGILIQLQLGT